MNRDQITAYSSPCFHAEETTHPRFLHTARYGNTYLSVILTANIGLE